MLRGVFCCKFGFVDSLVLCIGLFILFVIVVFIVCFYLLIGCLIIDCLVEIQMQFVVDQVEVCYICLLKIVEVMLCSSQGWGVNGDFEYVELQCFNEFFFLIIVYYGEIVLVIVVYEFGCEILLLFDVDGCWIN